MRPSWPWLVVGGALACVRGGTVGAAADRATSVVPATASVCGELDLAASAQSEILQDELLAKCRDRLLRRFGVEREDLQRARGKATVFALPGGAAAAFLPGVELD